jgi:FkbM family methyltransferase
MINTAAKLDALETPADLSSWRNAQPLMMRSAAWLNRVLPRGKGAVPRWIGRRFGDGWTTTIRTDSGCVLAVDPSNLDLFVTIEREGAWEPWIRRVCGLAMRDGGVMFDVGANAGAIANETALACPGITVKAFEPQLELAKLVVISAALNRLDDIEVFPVAVGESFGTVELHQPAHALHASLKASGEAGETRVTVPLVSLDELVFSDRLPPPTFIKVDVEGGELGVFKGASQLLKNHRPAVIFEANESAERFGYHREDVFNLIRQCGPYHFFRIAPGDVLACPEGRIDQFAPHYSRL